MNTIKTDEVFLYVLCVLFAAWLYNGFLSKRRELAILRRRSVIGPHYQPGESAVLVKWRGVLTGSILFYLLIIFIQFCLFYYT